MLFQLISDIHIDINPTYSLEVGTAVDCVIFAGDLANDPQLRNNSLVATADDIFSVKGNHDYYEEVLTPCQKIKEFPKEKTVILGCTFWTNFNNNDFFARYKASNSLLDYRKITTERGALIKAIDIYEAHLNDLAWLKKMLTKYKKWKIIVVTHHSPTNQSISEKYRGQTDLNGAFCSNYEQLIIENPQIKTWCYGHSHSSLDLLIGTTKVICNPHGYGDENPDFIPVKTFEI
jgi:predicted phosphodiesterase